MVLSPESADEVYENARRQARKLTLVQLREGVYDYQTKWNEYMQGHKRGPSTALIFRDAYMDELEARGEGIKR